MPGIKIIGTGSYAPDFIVTNDDFTKIVDTSDEWITTRTGMKRRHVSLDEPTWYLGGQAARRAIEAAGIAVNDIDMIVVTSVTQDFMFPSLACMIQRDIGNTSAFAMDISVACAGVTYSLDMARRYIATGDVKTVLVVAAERLTQVTNYEDRSTCVLFGDAAGACVVVGDDSLFSSYLSSDPEVMPTLYGRKKKHPLPFGEPGIPDKYELFDAPLEGSLYMNGKEVYKWASTNMPKWLTRACEKAGLTLQDLDLIIPHQANARIIESATKKMKVDPERIFVNIQEYGNTSSATIPVALDECVRSGRIRRGDKIGLVGFGAGMAIGATVFAY